MSAAVFDTLCRQSLARRPDELVAETMRRFSIADEAGLRARTGGTGPGSGDEQCHPSPWASRDLGRDPVGAPDGEPPGPLPGAPLELAHQPAPRAGRRRSATREVIRLVDGRRSRTALIESVKALAERGKLNLQQEGRPVTDLAAMTRLIPALVDHVLGFMASHALLVA